ncbi:hypothetical protein Q4F19_17190 [Sphingomonas sp. BIUV-7]|uniref:Baseplate assembly protein n=1 Tax=Sphingomonas natans TaxID=3063330 RepID=A0ABT8YCQ1_9SPHN|nr:hypothetical protein [Sphingomonas sp. BIUV-7]MDO6416124.1 hypothetical protein [Sphingomonas sp. BIUV-7]
MATCLCDARVFPPPPDIPAGLARLPRQIGGFPDFRAALLAGVALKPALDGWRAREGDDFGLMLLEWWAYVLDVLSFYSGELAGELYIRTAQRDRSLRRLVALIGYTPRPPLAASATLVLFAEAGRSISVPAGTAFRSDVVAGQAPQIFEASVDTQIHQSLNEWTIAPIRPQTFDRGPLLLDPKGASIAEGQIVLVESGSTRHAARIAAVASRRFLDGETYVQPTLAPAPMIPAAQQLATIRLSRPAQRAAANAFAGAPRARTGSVVTLILDALYPQLRAGTAVILEDAATGQLHVLTISSVALSHVPLAGSSPAPTVPFTQVTLAGAEPDWIGSVSPDRLVLHFNNVTAGRVVRPAKAEIMLGDLRASAPLTAPVKPLQLDTASRVLLRDALERGADLAANVTDDGAGNGTLRLLSTALLSSPLAAPVAAYGNLVAVTRGESVSEILGSGDATRAFQTFRLKKKPLTYIAAPGAPGGRQSTLRIWVDAVLWREVPSLFVAGPEDRVYTVRQTVDGETEIGFGGQGFGQPLPSGVSNVRAAYRFGGGAASPPAGALHQLARPVKGLRRATNPLAAFGGDDGDRPEDIRTAAPNSALALGRAIALPDFEAIARGYRGILNAAATWSWDTREQRAGVALWFVPPTDEGAEQLGADLAAYLHGIAAPGTPISVARATPVPMTLAVDLSVDADREPATVQAAVLARLTELLSPRQVPIGAPIFRADILAEARATKGVDEVRGVLSNGATAPFAFTVAEGQYLAITVVQAL